ncbi:hypothetical protein [Haloparvum sp. PAK95]|uniref:hypothetical protein n=1 Tax=Haloparvum sp. PAK95 TaxID=3418962 RepID=UPI003D2F0BD7
MRELLRARNAVAALGMLLLTAPWSLPALAGIVLPRGPYLLFLTPILGMAGIVYLTAVCWQYFVVDSGQSPNRAVQFTIVIFLAISAAVAVSWAGEPTVAFGLEFWSLLLPIPVLFMWLFAGTALANDNVQQGALLLGIPSAFGVLSVGLEGSFGLFMIFLYMFLYGVLGLPVLLLGFARTPHL